MEKHQLMCAGDCKVNGRVPVCEPPVSYLCVSLTLEEAAATFSRLLPLQMSARQTLNLMQPLGEALQQREDEQVNALWQQASQARTTVLAASTAKQESIDCLYIELDGVLARLWRGSVPMEEKECKRSGDVYREVKVGAVFEATQGPERSGLAPGVFVDQASQKHYVARRGKAEDFGKLLYALAVRCGLQRARQLVVLGDGAAWIWCAVSCHRARNATARFRVENGRRSVSRHLRRSEQTLIKNAPGLVRAEGFEEGRHPADQRTHPRAGVTRKVHEDIPPIRR